MTMQVQATTEQVPELGELVAQRRRQGLDTYDEWWGGVYRVVTGPNREHGRVILRLGALLDQLAADVGLQAAAPINIGIDKVDARVPDIGVVRPDVAMTSPAFHASAELVVEILSPDEHPGEKLPFYAAWGVREYLEVDLRARTCRLMRNEDGEWTAASRSAVVDLGVADVDALLSAL